MFVLAVEEKSTPGPLVVPAGVVSVRAVPVSDRTLLPLSPALSSAGEDQLVGVGALAYCGADVCAVEGGAVVDGRGRLSERGAGGQREGYG
jgi:hypothetical protein